MNEAFKIKCLKGHEPSPPPHSPQKREIYVPLTDEQSILLLRKKHYKEKVVYPQVDSPKT